MRWDDQKKLEKYVQDSGGSIEEEDEEEEEEIDDEDKDFSIEYAKSSRSTCKECEEKIQKDEVRGQACPCCFCFKIFLGK